MHACVCVCVCVCVLYLTSVAKLRHNTYVQGKAVWFDTKILAAGLLQMCFLAVFRQLRVCSCSPLKEEELTVARSKVMNKEEFQAHEMLRFSRVMKKLDTATVGCHFCLCVSCFLYILCTLLSLLDFSHGKWRGLFLTKPGCDRQPSSVHYSLLTNCVIGRTLGTI